MGSAGSATSGPTYDDPIVLKKKKKTIGQDDDGYINTTKCIAYKPSTAAAAVVLSSSVSIDHQTFRPSSPVDEYEIMTHQLTFRGNM